MHASHAFLNGAADPRAENLALLKALRAVGAEPPSLDKDQGEVADERQAERERKAPTANEQPGGFKNDPDDASNPNEVRERFERKITPS